MRKKDSDVKKSVSIIKKMLKKNKPAAYIITGSGQKRLTDFFKVNTSISLSRLPGFGCPTVKGHSCKLMLCSYGNKKFLIQSGRSHLYEKNSMEEVLFPVKVVKKLGINRLLLLNSAGAVNNRFRTGDIVLIKDQINLMFRNSLFRNKNLMGNERFVPMRPCYDQGFIKYMKSLKVKKKAWKIGVYAGVIGPVYETEAELNMLESLGADVVGMSTVQEVIMARFLKLQTSGITVVSNARKDRTNHSDVIKQTDRYIQRLADIVKQYIDYI